MDKTPVFDGRMSLRLGLLHTAFHTALNHLARTCVLMNFLLLSLSPSATVYLSPPLFVCLSLYLSLSASLSLFIHSPLYLLSICLCLLVCPSARLSLSLVGDLLVLCVKHGRQSV